MDDRQFKVLLKILSAFILLSSYIIFHNILKFCNQHVTLTGDENSHNNWLMEQWLPNHLFLQDIDEQVNSKPETQVGTQIHIQINSSCTTYNIYSTCT